MRYLESISRKELMAANPLLAEMLRAAGLPGKRTVMFHPNAVTFVTRRPGADAWDEGSKTSLYLIRPDKSVHPLAAPPFDPTARHMDDAVHYVGNLDIVVEKGVTQGKTATPHIHFGRGWATLLPFLEKPTD